jgi:hypothetical protein
MPCYRKKSQSSIQGTGFFTKDTAGNGVFERANDTGGFLLGYRYNFNRWLAARGELRLRPQHAILFRRNTSPHPG